MFRKFRRALSFVLLMVSIALISLATLPNEHQMVVQMISATEMQQSSNGQGEPGLSTPNRRVVLEWPKSMRIGDHETITLLFEPAVTDPASSTQPESYSDIYTHYNLMAEARFNVAGITVMPANPTRESMPSGLPVKFTWKVNTDYIGSHTGSLWLSLRYLPLDGKQASQAPIYIHEITIQASSLFGMNESMAYLLGGVGVVLAILIVYDDLIVWIQKLLKK